MFHDLTIDIFHCCVFSRSSPKKIPNKSDLSCQDTPHRHWKVTLVICDVVVKGYKTFSFSAMLLR